MLQPGTWVQIKPEHRMASCCDQAEVIGPSFMMDDLQVYCLKFYVTPRFTQILQFSEDEFNPIEERKSEMTIDELINRYEHVSQETYTLAALFNVEANHVIHPRLQMDVPLKRLIRIVQEKKPHRLYYREGNLWATFEKGDYPANMGITISAPVE